MHSAIRPYVTTGIAIVGASVIAVAPVLPITAPPDIAIPAAHTSHAAYQLTAFPQDLITLVNGLVDALGVGAVTDLISSFTPANLIDLVAVAQGGLLNLAPVVYTLLNGLNNVVGTLLDGLNTLAGGGLTTLLHTVLTDVNTILGDGLNTLLSQGVTSVVTALTTGLALVVNAIFGGLNSPLNNLIDTVGGLLGGLFGAAAPAAPAAAALTAFGAADVTNASAAKTATLSVAGMGGTKRAAVPDTASPVAQEASSGASTQKATDVLTEVQANLPEQAKGVGLENAIANQDGATDTTDTAGANSVATATDSNAPAGGTTSASNSKGTSTSAKAGSNGGGTGTSANAGSAKKAHSSK